MTIKFQVTENNDEIKKYIEDNDDALFFDFSQYDDFFEDTSFVMIEERSRNDFYEELKKAIDFEFSVGEQYGVLIGQFQPEIASLKRKLKNYKGDMSIDWAMCVGSPKEDDALKEIIILFQQYEARKFGTNFNIVDFI